MLPPVSVGGGGVMLELLRLSSLRVALVDGLSLPAVCSSVLVVSIWVVVLSASDIEPLGLSLGAFGLHLCAQWLLSGRSVEAQWMLSGLSVGAK